MQCQNSRIHHGHLLTRMCKKWVFGNLACMWRFPRLVTFSGQWQQQIEQIYKRQLSKLTIHSWDIAQSVILVPVVTKVQSCSAQLVQASQVPPISQQDMLRLLPGLLYSESILNGVFICIVVNVPTVSIILKIHVYSLCSVFLIHLSGFHSADVDWR